MIDSEDSRLKAFRQMKAQIRGSKEWLVVGIDIAREKHHAFFGTPTGKTLWKRLVFENRFKGFEKFHIRVDALKVQHGLDNLVFGLEPTANHHNPNVAKVEDAADSRRRGCSPDEIGISSAFPKGKQHGFFRGSLDVTDGGIQRDGQKWRRALLFFSFHTFRRVVYATMGISLWRIT